MARRSKIVLVLIAAVAIFIQVPIVQRFENLLRLGLAIGKVIQPIADFANHKCIRIYDDRLESCEDMWLSGATRQLFLACSQAASRPHWMPGEGAFNLDRRPTNDGIVVMDLDTMATRSLPMSGFTGTADDGIINLTGLTGLDKDDGSIELLVVNFRPSINVSTGEIATNQAELGSNATIEVFRTGAEAKSLMHIHTLADPAIATPNRVAAIDGKGLFISNDHGQRKVGLMNRLSPLLQTGDVVFCPANWTDHYQCEIVSGGHGYPNGLWYSSLDGRIYLPCSAEGGIKVLEPSSRGSLEAVDKIEFPYAVDNISEDRDGVLWAAALPRGIDIMRQSKSPLTYSPASTILKISRAGNGTVEVQKAVEDRDGEVLPGTTSVVHDVATGKLFLSGVFSPFITVCEVV